MNSVRFASAMNNTTTNDAFNCDNRNIALIKTQHCQIMTTITNRILIFEPMIKKSIVEFYTFFTVITSRRIDSI